MPFVSMLPLKTVQSSVIAAQQAMQAHAASTRRGGVLSYTGSRAHQRRPQPFSGNKKRVRHARRAKRKRQKPVKPPQHVCCNNAARGNCCVNRKPAAKPLLQCAACRSKHTAPEKPAQKPQRHIHRNRPVSIKAAADQHTGKRPAHRDNGAAFKQLRVPQK